VCGLIGPNGAGKTTLVNLLSGLVPASSGTVSLSGTPLLGMKPIERVRFGVRRSFQTEQVVEDLNVWDNVRALLDHVPHERGAGGGGRWRRVLEFTGLARRGRRCWASSSTCSSAAWSRWPRRWSARPEAAAVRRARRGPDRTRIAAAAPSIVAIGTLLARRCC
jgi:ABC-type Fe3+/spermidine/putrescine transport system ATPase subunit